MKIVVDDFTHKEVLALNKSFDHWRTIFSPVIVNKVSICSVCAILIKTEGTIPRRKAIIFFYDEVGKVLCSLPVMEDEVIIFQTEDKFTTINVAKRGLLVWPFVEV